MAKQFLTYQQIIDYLKGLLSNQQRNDLEKQVMRDAFDDEAFEGLKQLSAVELEADMNAMERRLEERMRQPGKRILPQYLRIAASLILLAALGSVLYFLLSDRSEQFVPREIAQEKVVERSVEENLIETLPAADHVTRQQETETMIAAQPMEEKKTMEMVVQGDQKVYEEPVDMQEEAVTEMRASEANEIPVPEGLKKITATAEVIQEPEVVSEPSAAEYARMADKSRIALKETGPPASKVFKARVVDQEGQPLPGVAVLETGTSNGTVTDADGMFSLLMIDTSSTLALRSVGFKEVEIPGTEIPGQNIMMQEDMLALEEVVVVGYATEKKADFTGAVSTIVFDGRLRSSGTTIELTRPVPPGGSLRAYKKLVEGELDHEILSILPGRYRIEVTLSIQQDGQVYSINIHSNIPAPIAEEYKRCIAEIQPWQAASEGGIPVESQVDIIFDLNIE